MAAWPGGNAMSAGQGKAASSDPTRAFALISFCPGSSPAHSCTAQQAMPRRCLQTWLPSQGCVFQCPGRAASPKPSLFLLCLPGSADRSSNNPHYLQQQQGLPQASCYLPRALVDWQRKHSSVRKHHLRHSSAVSAQNRKTPFHRVCFRPYPLTPPLLHFEAFYFMW